jgi:hypothetical protein
MNENKMTLRSKFILLTILALLSLSSEAWGAIYYVDATNGNDLNIGTSTTHAWRTIQHAADVAQAGDIVYIKEGTYNEKVSFANSGTSQNKITFISSPRRSATVDGGFDIGKGYIRVEGFQITSSSNVWSAIVISGDHVDVVDNYFYNVRGRAIAGNENRQADGAYIADNHIYHSQMGIAVWGSNWLVENNEVERLYMYGATNDCDYARFFGDNNVFRGNYFHGTLSSEIGSAHTDCWQSWEYGYSKTTHNTVMDNNICYNFHQAIMVEPGNGTIDTITFTNNIVGHTSLGWGGYGINNEGIDHITVMNNNFIDIRYGGADMLQGSTRAEHAVIKNNIFYNCGRSYSFSDPSTSVGDYNLVYQTSENPDKGPHDMIDVNPMFVDPANDDYSLQPNSPACGAGEGGSDIGAIPCAGSMPPAQP